MRLGSLYLRPFLRRVVVVVVASYCAFVEGILVSVVAKFPTLLAPALFATIGMSVLHSQLGEVAAQCCVASTPYHTLWHCAYIHYHFCDIQRDRGFVGMPEAKSLPHPLDSFLVVVLGKMGLLSTTPTLRSSDSFYSSHMCRKASREITRTCFGIIFSSLLMTPLSSGIGSGADSMM